MNRKLEMPAGVGWAGLGWAPHPWVWKYRAGPDDALVVGSVSRRSEGEQQTREGGLCRIIGDCGKLPHQMDIGHLMLRGTWKQRGKRTHNFEERQARSQHCDFSLTRKPRESGPCRARK